MSDIETRYVHTQRSRLLLVMMLLAAAAIGAALLATAKSALPLGARLALGASFVVLCLTAMIFRSLTIEVGGGRLVWSFGLGAHRKSVALEDIATAEPTRASWLAGRGIHWTTRGWLYNVGGSEAVLVSMRNGKRFLLGTDDSQTLTRAIMSAVERGRAGGGR